MSANRNLSQRIRQALYSLKREYGAGPLSIYTFGGTTVALNTGVKTVTKSVTVVSRVIVLPAKVTRDVVQTISMISANKQFVYGGSYDSRARTFIIDRRDTPSLELKDDDWFVFESRRYEIKSIQEFENNSAWVVVGRQVIGEIPEQIHLLKADHFLDLSSMAASE
jgi:hypothetical protein